MVMVATMPTEVHGAKNRHDLPVAARCRLMNAPAAHTARIEPCHRSSHTTLVQENQPLRRDRLDACRELFAALAIGFGVALDCMERLFFSRSPNLFNKCQTRPRLSEMLASLCSLACRDRKSTRLN